MDSMFYNCMFFNKKLEWNTSKVTNMNSMFEGCINFNQTIGFDMTNVKDIDNMFKDCINLHPKNLKNFSKDEIIENFYYLSKLPKFIAKNKWIDMENGKFKPKNKAELKALVYTDDIKLDRIDTSKISDMSHLFNATFDSKRTDFSGINTWDTSKVVYMDAMFFNCGRFNEKLNFDTSSVTDMSYMFYGCFSFNQSLDFDTSSVTDMDGMFEGCESLEQLPEFYKKFCEENEE